MADNWAKGLPAGKVEDYANKAVDPPESSLVTAFDTQNVDAADAIVLRGYLGRSNIIRRTREYLARARSEHIAQMREEALALNVSSYRALKLAEFLDDQATTAAKFKAEATALGFTNAQRDQLAASNPVKQVVNINSLLRSLNAARPLMKDHIPWRLYLTPRLDRYVDFHRSSLLAWRQEPKTERQDACTVWLRVFEMGAQVPILYRLVTETTLVPSFATWVSGQLIDDYAEAGGAGSAWGDQTSGLHGTGKTCLRGTTRLCMD